MPVRRAVGLVVVGLLVGCGREAPQEPPDAPPRVAPPAPLAATGRAELSRELRAALDASDLERAAQALRGLDEHHGGTGELPDGRALSPEAVVGALFDAAVAAARERSSGPTPAPERARSALALAHSLAPRVDEEASARALAAADRWVSLERVGDLATPLAPHAGPRVIVACDDFDLGEPDLLRVLSRWQEEGREAGLRVAVLPFYRGLIRVGMRRTRAQDHAEELRSLAARLAPRALPLEPEPASAEALSRDLGLLGQDMALLVADREGRIVARLSGRALDATRLESAVQRVGSR